jgi:hypothetical protein
MRVLESCDGLDLPLKSLRPKRVGKLGMQDLQCHRALVPEILSQEDGGHTPTAQRAVQPVSILQSILEQLAEVSHLSYSVNEDLAEYILRRAGWWQSLVG